MQQTRGSAVAVAILTMLTGAPAVHASAPASFDADARVDYNRGGGTVHCGDTLTQHTKLSHDLSCPGTASFALRIAGEGVVLDLGGYTIRSTGPVNPESRGVAVDAPSMVRNGTIQGFGIGVTTSEGMTVPHLRLHQLALVDNRVAVYNHVPDARFLITECRLDGSTFGLFSELDIATGSFDVRSSVFTRNWSAMFVDHHSVDVLDSTFTSNQSVFNCWQGRVRFRSSTLAWNTAVGTIPNDGVRQCEEMRFENALVANNAAVVPPGSPAWQPRKLSLLDSLFVSNGSGVQAAAETVYIDGNTFFDNAAGLTLSDRESPSPVVLTGIVRGNQFLGNDGDGLRVQAPSTPTVITNVALGNSGFGIYAPTAFDGGGNVARDNGAGDCVGILCAPY